MTLFGALADDPIAQRLQDREFNVTGKLGKGGFGSVYDAKCRKSGARVAIKALSKQEAVKLSMVDRVLQEVSIHSVVKHEHIVPLLDFFEDADCVYLVLHPCNNGNMFQLMKHNGSLDIEAVRHFGTHLFRALAYLHTLGILHRDLKLSNLLLDAAPSSATAKSPFNLTLQLCDFGLAVRTSGDSEHRTVCGTPVYQAPEVRSGAVGGQATEPHTYATDIYSAGCLLYSMLVGRPPLETPVDAAGEPMNPHARARLSADYEAHMEHIKRVSPRAAQLIRWCMADTPAARPTAAAVLQHAFFTESVPANSKMGVVSGTDEQPSAEAAKAGVQAVHKESRKKQSSSKATALLSPPLTPIQARGSTVLVARAAVSPPPMLSELGQQQDGSSRLERLNTTGKPGSAGKVWPEMSFIQSRTGSQLPQQRATTLAPQAGSSSNRRSNAQMNTSSFSTASTVAGPDNNTVLTFSGSHLSDTVVQLADAAAAASTMPAPVPSAAEAQDSGPSTQHTPMAKSKTEADTGGSGTSALDGAAYPRVLTPELDRVDDWDKEMPPSSTDLQHHLPAQGADGMQQPPSPTPSPYDPMAYAAVNITPVGHHGGRQPVLVPSPEWALSLDASFGGLSSSIQSSRSHATGIAQASSAVMLSMKKSASTPQLVQHAAGTASTSSVKRDMAITPVAQQLRPTVNTPGPTSTTSGLDLVPPPVVAHTHGHADVARSGQGAQRYQDRSRASSSSSTVSGTRTLSVAGRTSGPLEAYEQKKLDNSAGSIRLRPQSTSPSSQLGPVRLQLSPSPAMPVPLPVAGPVVRSEASPALPPPPPPPSGSPANKPSAGRALLQKRSAGAQKQEVAMTSTSTEEPFVAAITGRDKDHDQVDYPRIRTPTPISMASSSDSENERPTRKRDGRAVRLPASGGRHDPTPMTVPHAVPHTPVAAVPLSQARIDDESATSSSAEDSDASEGADMSVHARLIRSSLGVAGTRHVAVPRRAARVSRKAVSTRTLTQSQPAALAERTPVTNHVAVRPRPSSARLASAALPAARTPSVKGSGPRPSPVQGPAAIPTAARDSPQSHAVFSQVEAVSAISRVTSDSGFRSLFDQSTVVHEAKAQAVQPRVHSQIAGIHASSASQSKLRSLDAAASQFQAVDSALLEQHSNRVAGELARLQQQQQILNARLQTARAFHAGLDAGAANVLSLYSASQSVLPPSLSSSAGRAMRDDGRSGKASGTATATLGLSQTLPVNQTLSSAVAPVTKPSVARRVPARFELSVAEAEGSVSHQFATTRQQLQGLVQEIGRSCAVSDVGLSHSGSTVALSDAGMQSAARPGTAPFLSSVLDTSRLRCKPIAAYCGDNAQTKVQLAANGDIVVSPGAACQDLYSTELMILPVQGLVQVLQRTPGQSVVPVADTVKHLQLPHLAVTDLSRRRPVAVVPLDRCCSVSSLRSAHNLDGSTAGLVKHMVKCAQAVVRTLRSKTARVAILSHDCSAIMMDDAPAATFELTVHLDRVSHPLQRPASVGTKDVAEGCRWRLRYSMRDQRLVVTDPAGTGYAAYVRPPAHVRVHLESAQAGAFEAQSGATRVYLDPATLPAPVLYLYTLAMTALSRCVQLETQVLAKGTASNLSHTGSSSDGTSSSSGHRGSYGLEIASACAPASAHELPSFLSTTSSSHWTSVSNRQAGTSKVQGRHTHAAGSSGLLGHGGCVEYPLVLQEDAYWLPDMAVAQLLKY